YRKLDCANREIRLLELEPGSPSATIKAKLRHVTLTSKPTYEALSYTWGSPADRRPMSLDGFNGTVTANLSAALRQLCNQDRPRVLWVDALCVNQDDKDERREQVLIMRDIYEAATKVLAWLGPASDDSDLAMDLVDKRRTDLILQSQSRESSAFEKLCSRPYWTRVWILQELAVNRQRCVFG
ncbi:HET-domain-containing protein, partial [Parathielavia hyrcaniae]